MASRPGTSRGTHLDAAGVARYVVTDRHGIRATPSVPSSRDPEALLLGASAAPYDRLDLAGHVGDDPGAVAANRVQVATALGLTPDRLALMDQVHGADVAVVDESRRTVDRVDALVTTARGIALTVLVADCVPVVLADEVAGVVALAHAGRRGVQLGVVASTVGAMRDLGASPARIGAVVGPAVCPSCYEVPEQMRAEVAAVVPQAHAVSRTGTPALNLRRAVAAQLVDAGVDRVDAVGGCTAEDPTLYSYRRDGRTGRFAMLAWLPDEQPPDEQPSDEHLPDGPSGTSA